MSHNSGRDPTVRSLPRSTGPRTMTSTATPSLPAARAPRGPSLWLRLLLLAAVGGGLTSPLVLAAVMHWRARDGVAVAEQFLIALRDGEKDQLAALLTPQARAAETGTVADSTPAAARIVNTCSSYLQGYTFSPGAPFRRNDTLTIPFVLRSDKMVSTSQTGQTPAGLSGNSAGPSQGISGEVVLRQAGGAWRVAGLHLPATQRLQQGLVLDFEHPGSDKAVPQEPTRQVKDNFDQVSPVTPEEFAAAWQADVDVENVPAADLLTTLAKEAGLQTDSKNPLIATVTEDVKEALSRRVSLHLHKVSRLQAIEDVCRQIGVYPNYLGGGIVQYQLGKRRFPIAFSGPFLLLVTGLTEDAPNAAGTLTLQLTTTPLPPKIAALFAMIPLSVSLQGVTGAAGQDLFSAEKGIPSGVNNYRGTRGPGEFYVTLGPNQLTSHWSVPLKNLLRDVDAIREVRFTLRATLPGEVHPLRLEPVVAGATTADDAVRLTLSKISPPPPAGAGNALNKVFLTNFDFRVEPPGRLHLCWRVQYPNNVVATGWASFPHTGEFTVPAVGEPSRFAFKVMSAWKDLAWDFTFRDIPLARPPRKIEPARFDGHPAPVQVSEARISERGVDLRIANDCQKELDTVDLKLVYRDEEGHVVGEVARKVAERFGEGVDLFPAPRFPAKVDPEWRVQDLAGLPQGTRSITATVTGVLFKDGTTWRP
jgi:hypothetical protein